MKKTFALLAVFAIALCASCSKDQEIETEDKIVPGEEQTGEGVTTFTASIPETKTYLGEPEGDVGSRTWPNLWSEGDAVNVNGVNSIGLTEETGANTSDAIFNMETPVSGPNYYAVSPASAVTSYDGSKYQHTVSISETQSFVADSYDPAAYLMAVKNTTPSLNFAPLMGLIQLKTTGPATGTLYIKSISVESVGDETMTGSFTTNADHTAITGGSGKQITISAPAGTTKPFGTVFTFAVPAQNYASGIRFRITATTDDEGTEGEQTMVFAKQSAFNVTVGTLYPLTAPAFKESAITVTCPFKTSSSAGLAWSGANASNQNNFKKAWRLAVYSDSGCNTLIVQHDIPADPNKVGVWSGMSADGNPHFIIGGLSAGTTYYAKVTDIQNNTSSAPFEFTTDSFTVVPASSPVGSTLVAEDFSEFGWGPAYLGGVAAANRYAGWSPVSGASSNISFAAPSGVVTTGYYKAYNYSANELTTFDYSTAPRFNAGWGYCYEGGFAGFTQAGHLRMGGANDKRSFVVCPALSGITSGKFATVDVTVKVAHMEAAAVTDNPEFAVFIESDLSLTDASQRMYTGATLNRRYPVVLTKYGHQSDVLTFRVNGLQRTDHLMVGAYNNVNEHNRYTLYSIKVDKISESDTETFDITDVQTLELFHDRVAGGAAALNGNVVNDINASSIASSWTPLAGYTGTLSGNSKIITGLTKPFFADLQGDVDHLTLNSTINATADTFGEGPAIFAQSLSAGGSIDYCTSKGSVTYQPSTAVTNATRYVGGLVAYVTDGSVTHCSNEANVSFPHNSQTNDMNVAVGGVIGKLDHASGSCSDLSNSGSVSVGIINAIETSRWMSVGGVVGEANRTGGATITNLTNDGQVSLSGSATGELCVGGVIGYGERTFSGCSNLKQVSYSGASGGELFVGGIIGKNNGDDKIISSTTNSGKVLINSSIQSGQHIYIGGVAGETKGKITATNSGEVTISRVACRDINLGGIVGLAAKGGVGTGSTNQSTGVISLSNISATAAAYIGGVAGRAYGSGSIIATNNGSLPINSSCSSSSHLYLGGIVGYTTRALSGCTNNGALTNHMSMTGSDRMLCVGGIAGRNAPTSTPNYVATITNCHNTVSLSNDATSGGELNIGGISAYSECTISSSTNIGNITNSGASSDSKNIAIGGVVGNAHSDITECSYGTSTISGGTVSNSGTSTGSICIGGVVGGGLDGKTVSGCYNKGSVGNSGDGVILAIGGLAGWADAATFSSACYNTGAISNSGTASEGDGSIPGVRIGGLVGCAPGVTDLSGTAGSYHYNNGSISESSESTHVAVSGVCAFSDNTSSTFEYAQNKSNGDISIGTGDYDQVWVGGVVGLGNEPTIDHSSNAGDIVFDTVTTDQLWCGGVIGKWKDETTKTIQYCANSGTITTKTHDWATERDLYPRKYACAYSYIGGIAGGGPNRQVGKTYSNCTSSGDINIYSPICFMIGGITSAVTTATPSDCIVKASITFKRNSAAFQEEGAAKAGTNNNSYVAGIVGYADLTSFSGLLFRGSIDTMSSNAVKAAGIVAYQSGSKSVTFTNCKVGGTRLRAAQSGDNMVGIFEQGTNNTSRSYTFPGCVIETGLLWDGDSDITINSSSNVTIKMCAGPNCKLASGGALPSVGSVTWPDIP